MNGHTSKFYLHQLICGLELNLVNVRIKLKVAQVTFKAVFALRIPSYKFAKVQEMHAQKPNERRNVFRRNLCNLNCRTEILVVGKLIDSASFNNIIGRHEN